MHVLINALSITNLSGRHVLFGHLNQLIKRTNGRQIYSILYHNKNRHICQDFGQLVNWIECPEPSGHWAYRSFWEHSMLPRLVKRLDADLMWLPTGTVVSGFPIPQISYAMNPWALVRDVNKGPLDRIKAFMQKIGYRKAMRTASVMLFLSEYMRQIFRKNAGFIEKTSEVVYTGLDDVLFEKAKQSENLINRNQFQILSVSVMAPHKGIETLVAAVARIRRRKIPARLLLVGAWPDSGYEKRIRSMVEREQIQDHVEFKGHVPIDQLHRHYAESQAFCLMSQCESFGIPAVEAQAFGTPVASSNCCAIPEVCGSGGIYPELGNIEATADALEMMLTDDRKWQEMSHLAIRNAQKYRWGNCSKPLLKVFGLD